MAKQTFYFVKYDKNFVNTHIESLIADYPTAKLFVGSDFIRFHSLNDFGAMYYVEASTVKEANEKWSTAKLND